MVERRLRTAQAAARGTASPSTRSSRSAIAPSPAPAASQRRSRPGVREERGHGYVRTSTAHKKEVYDETDRELDVNRREFEQGEEPAFVQVGAGLTINMGNFESLRIDCQVRLPCRPDELDETYDQAANFVADKIAEEQTRWLGQSNGKSRG